MIPDDAGTWMVHCHVNDHFDAGMLASYIVDPCDGECPREDPSLSAAVTVRSAAVTFVMATVAALLFVIA